ncbi:hypothetical protein L596_002471 [Steinernema carpocapsae]|uniref:Uncharacterized protein n=1 Tax=Steinernema carpocapsae TaxID=34508 RepID=A0A4U8UPV2_STECR|nr:hypothetical protein L596_002471 [Steinernema carpocapsae]
MQITTEANFPTLLTCRPLSRDAPCVSGVFSARISIGLANPKCQQRPKVCLPPLKRHENPSAVCRFMGLARATSGFPC